MKIKRIYHKKRKWNWRIRILFFLCLIWKFCKIYLRILRTMRMRIDEPISLRGGSKKLWRRMKRGGQRVKERRWGRDGCLTSNLLAVIRTPYRWWSLQDLWSLPYFATGGIFRSNPSDWSWSLVAHGRFVCRRYLSVPRRCLNACQKLKLSLRLRKHTRKNANGTRKVVWLRVFLFQESTVIEKL